MGTSRLVHTVKLKFKQDDVTGDYGVVTKECEATFNTFWNGVGIFHDVFEHWFEHRHKYFKADFAENLGGECAAMGAAHYYYQHLGVSNRPLGGSGTFEDAVMRQISDDAEEAIHTGYARYGDTFNCKVPRQRNIHPSIPWLAESCYDKISSAYFEPSEYTDSEDALRAEAYKRSVTKPKLLNLYAWGFNMAEKLVPCSGYNAMMLTEFIANMEKFCRNNSAEELSSFCKEMVVKLFRTKTDIKVKVELVLLEGHTLCIKKSGKDDYDTKFIMEDIYDLFAEY